MNGLMMSILHVMRICIRTNPGVQELYVMDWGVAEGLVFENLRSRSLTGLKVEKKTSCSSWQ